MWNYGSLNAFDPPHKQTFRISISSELKSRCRWDLTTVSLKNSAFLSNETAAVFAVKVSTSTEAEAARICVMLPLEWWDEPEKLGCFFPRCGKTSSVPFSVTSKHGSDKLPGRRFSRFSRIVDWNISPLSAVLFTSVELSPSAKPDIL